MDKPIQTPRAQRPECPVLDLQADQMDGPEEGLGLAKTSQSNTV
jgi:hypothetical protein